MNNTRPNSAAHGVFSRSPRYPLFIATIFCGATLVMAPSAVHAAPPARARKAANECRAHFEQQLATLRSLQLPAPEKATRTNAAYDDLAACLKANGMLSLLPKRPTAATASRNQPANRTATSVTPSATPAPKKKAWITRPASQTGSHL